jgi:hypothetical protein
MEIIEEWPEGTDPNPKLIKSCKNCRHFCPYVYEFDTDTPSEQLVSDYGECRRFPPKLVPAEDNGFPVVEETSWCGEFDF